MREVTNDPYRFLLHVWNKRPVLWPRIPNRYLREIIVLTKHAQQAYPAVKFP